MGALGKIGISVGIGLGTALVTLTGVAVAKLNKLSRKFDKSVSELEETTVKDIQQAVVQKAVDNAAKNTVKDYMRDVHTVVMADARSELQKEARLAIDDARKDIHAKVADTTAEEVAKIDMAAFRREVREEAEEKILAKFDDNLQDIMDKFSGNLGSMYKTYANFADMMKNLNMRKDEGVKFTIGG